MLGEDAPGESPAGGKAHKFLLKESLIRKGAEYAVCYAEGRRLYTRHFLLFVAPPKEGESNMRMGAAVSRKVGHAVVRNRIKRLLRECFRLSLQSMPAARVVVVAKKAAGMDPLCLADVTGELTSVLDKYFCRKVDS